MKWFGGMFITDLRLRSCHRYGVTEIIYKPNQPKEYPEHGKEILPSSRSEERIK